MVRALVFGLVALAACGRTPRPPDRSSPPLPDAADPAPALAPDGPPADAFSVASWRYGDPIPCNTDDDCVLVPPGHLSCGGPCGFCPGQFLVPRGTPAIKCPAPEHPVDERGPPEVPQCSPCVRVPTLRATCRASVCATEPVDP